MFPDSATSQPSIGQESHPSTYSLEVSPASRSASPGSNDGWTTIVGYGPSSPEPFASYDPDTSSWKMSQGSLWEAGWTPYSGIWPSSGMTRSGRAFPRRPLVPRTSVTGSGSSLTGKETHHVPTPTASDHIERESTSTEVLNFDTNKSVSLDRWAKRWPTPTARDHKDGQFNPNVPINGLLGRAVWRTPTARDHKGASGVAYKLERGSAVGLNDQVKSENGGALNPAWVEWLMGFPPGWTDIGPQSRKASRASRTASSPESTD
jgi:hypothetical protein